MNRILLRLLTLALSLSLLPAGRQIRILQDQSESKQALESPRSFPAN